MSEPEGFFMEVKFGKKHLTDDDIKQFLAEMRSKVCAVALKGKHLDKGLLFLGTFSEAKENFLVQTQKIFGVSAVRYLPIE